VVHVAVLGPLWTPVIDRSIVCPAIVTVVKISNLVYSQNPATFGWE
jgi:hypothetical protein